MTNLTPTEIYLLSLQSKVSKTCMVSRFNIIADKLQGVSSHRELDWSKVNYVSVLSLIQSMTEEGKSPSTVNTYLSAIKGGANAAWKESVLSVEDYQRIKDVKRVKGVRSDKGISLTTQEVKALITTCDGSVSSLRDSALLALTYSAGLRREEVAKLDISAIDMIEESVTIMGKGNKQVTNPINSSAVVVLQKWIKVRGKGKGGLFPRIRKGGNISTECISGQGVGDLVIKRAKTIGLVRLSSHDLRRSFCTNLLEAGEDLFTVSSLMRHASLSTTQIYDKRSNIVKKQAAKRLSF